jgi:methylaspartate ammonia-lyase
MTDEWPNNLVANLRMAKMAAPTFAKDWCIKAADEIERLMKVNKILLCEAEEFRKYVHWASSEIDMTRISAEWLPPFHADVMERAANVIEQLAKDLQFQYEREKTQQQEIERLVADNKMLHTELEGLLWTARAE